MIKGVVLSLFSSLLFGLLYYFPVLLQPLNGDIIFAWRIVWTATALFIFILLSGYWRTTLSFFARVGQERILILAIPLSSLLLGVQMWLFMWSPLHGRALSTSLGYFLLPLMMVLTGRILYKEHLTAIQCMAVLCAALGVGIEIIYSHSFSWDTALVALGYPLYLVLRRHFKIIGLVGFFSDIIFSLPYALFIIISEPAEYILVTHSISLIMGVILLGIISAVALYCYLSASCLLPLGILGLLGYVEPLLLTLVALLLLKEPLTLQQALTYIPIWISVGLLLLEGIYRNRQLFTRKK